MSRKHLFVIVVMLGAAAFAGLLALTRTSTLGQPTSSSAGSDAAITFRLQKLDRLEGQLARQLAAKPVRANAAPVTVYRRATAPASASASVGWAGGDDHGSEGRDD